MPTNLFHLQAARINPCAVFEPDFIQLYSNETSRSVFLSKARKSKEREALKERTGLSDEQIEGWFKMFERGGQVSVKIHYAASEEI